MPATLLNEDGELTPEFENTLTYIFSKYCTSSSAAASQAGEGTSANGTSSPSSSSVALANDKPPFSPTSLPFSGGRKPPVDAYLTTEGLDRFAIDTNGSPFDEESKKEILDFLDVNDQGFMTLEGFMQMYSLQTENDPSETWADLGKHGFDESLNLVSTRREDHGVDEGEPVPKHKLKGIGMGGTMRHRDSSTSLIGKEGGETVEESEKAGEAERDGSEA